MNNEIQEQSAYNTPKSISSYLILVQSITVN